MARMHWHSLINWLPSCLPARALLRTILYERKRRANKMTALDAAMTLLFHIVGFFSARIYLRWRGPIRYSLRRNLQWGDRWIRF